MNCIADNNFLRQIPLTVSPFVHIPSAVTLPYSYQSLPLALPHSSTGVTADGSTPTGYITSPSGNVSTTPDTIIKSCTEIILHIQSTANSAEKVLAEWEKSIEDRELMEKRRVAPGYLDTGLRMLEPTRKQAVERPTTAADAPSELENRNDRTAGDELDRMFGQMSM